MDSFSSFLDLQFSSRNRHSYNSPKNYRQISPVVQDHLKQVSLSLCCALLAFAAGVYLHILYHVGGTLTFLGCIRCIFWLKATPSHQEQKKVSLLMATALLQGATTGPLVQHAIVFDPSIVFSAFIGCSLAFGCSFGAALLARQREYLHLGCLLSFVLSILVWLYSASFIFSGSMALLNYKLLVFVFIIVNDTQNIIEKAQLGDLDYVNHAHTLFLDFVAGSLRFLQIGFKNTFEKEEKKNKKKKVEEEERS